MNRHGYLFVMQYLLIDSFIDIMYIDIYLFILETDNSYMHG